MTARGTARLLAAALIVAGIQMNTMYDADIEDLSELEKENDEQV